MADNSGSVAYEYCLTCDSAMSRRFVYAGGTTVRQGEILQAQRFMYDGLTLLRAAQLYDSDEDEALEMTDGPRAAPRADSPLYSPAIRSSNRTSPETLW